jgi:hypothetical protein
MSPTTLHSTCCLLPATAGTPLGRMELPQSRLWGGVPQVKSESKTEIPAETLCINNERGLPKIETICGTFRSSEGNTQR